MKFYNWLITIRNQVCVCNAHSRDLAKTIGLMNNKVFYFRSVAVFDMFPIKLYFSRDSLEIHDAEIDYEIWK